MVGMDMVGMDMVGMVNMIRYEYKHRKHVNDIQNARRTSWCLSLVFFSYDDEDALPACLANDLVAS